MNTRINTLYGALILFAIMIMMSYAMIKFTKDFTNSLEFYGDIEMVEKKS